MTDDKTPEKTKWLVFLVVLAITPPWMILSAKIHMHVWDLTMHEQFGEGPTLRSWIGISSLLFLVQRRSRRDDDKRSVQKQVIEGLLGYAFSVLLVLFTVFIISQMQGWS